MPTQLAPRHIVRPPLHCGLCPVSTGPRRPSGRPGAASVLYSVLWVKLRFLSEDIWETIPKDLACVLLLQSMCVFVWLLNREQCPHAGDQILVGRHSQLMGLSEGLLGDVRGCQTSQLFRGYPRLGPDSSILAEWTAAGVRPFHLGPTALSGTSVSRPSSAPRARGWWPPRTLWPVDLP